MKSVNMRTQVTKLLYIAHRCKDVLITKYIFNLVPFSNKCMKHFELFKLPNDQIKNTHLNLNIYESWQNNALCIFLLKINKINKEAPTSSFSKHCSPHLSNTAKGHLIAKGNLASSILPKKYKTNLKLLIFALMYWGKQFFVRFLGRI